VLENHQTFARLEDLRPHFDLVVGSSGDATHVASVRTHRERVNPAYAQDLICSTQLAAAVASRARPREGTVREGPCRVLLVFGREDSGLRLSESRLCDLVMTIPTFGPGGIRDAHAHPSDASLNLSHAVTCVLYSLRSGEGQSTSSVAEVADMGPMEKPKLTEGKGGKGKERKVAPLMGLEDQARLHDALEELFTYGHNFDGPREPEKVAALDRKVAYALDSGALYNIKRALGRANLSQSEFAQLMGLFRRATDREVNDDSLC
jgi:tRNA C32,U32 (ribose-2'-O)-methylase TrmJ